MDDTKANRLRAKLDAQTEILKSQEKTNETTTAILKRHDADIAELKARLDELWRSGGFRK